VFDLSIPVLSFCCVYSSVETRGQTRGDPTPNILDRCNPMNEGSSCDAMGQNGEFNRALESGSAGGNSLLLESIMMVVKVHRGTAVRIGGHQKATNRDAFARRNQSINTKSSACKTEKSRDRSKFPGGIAKRWPAAQNSSALAPRCAGLQSVCSVMRIAGPSLVVFLTEWQRRTGRITKR